MKRYVICDDCKKQVKQRSRCICGMWTCVNCTLSLRHDTSRGEHWKMLAASHGMPVSDDKSDEAMLEWLQRGRVK